MDKSEIYSNLYIDGDDAVIDGEGQNISVTRLINMDKDGYKKYILPVEVNYAKIYR